MGPAGAPRKRTGAPDACYTEEMDQQTASENTEFPLARKRPLSEVTPADQPYAGSHRPEGYLL